MQMISYSRALLLLFIILSSKGTQQLVPMPIWTTLVRGVLLQSLTSLFQWSRLSLAEAMFPAAWVFEPVCVLDRYGFYCYAIGLQGSVRFADFT